MSTSVSGGGMAPRKWRRTHGLQPPLHPQQAAACLFLALFTLLNFGVLLPALHSSIFLYVVSNLKMKCDPTGFLHRRYSIQGYPFTVTPSGHAKRITVSNCHTKQRPFVNKYVVRGLPKVSMHGECHSKQCHCRRAPPRT